jgi:hypothetical protein
MLYRSSRQNSKRAYNAGYASACQDLLTVVQQGVSLDPSGSLDAEGGGMTIGRVMDWTEARLEAIRSREEEEEDEEREKEKERGRPPASNPATAPKPEDKIYSTPSSSMSPPKGRVCLFSSRLTLFNTFFLYSPCLCRHPILHTHNRVPSFLVNPLRLHRPKQPPFGPSNAQ